MKLGEKSRFYEMAMMWPKDADILMNWNEEELEWLQDESLVSDAEKGYDDFLAQWDKLYRCLKKYPELFQPQDISLAKFKWVYILLTNRCFGSNFLGNYQMVPFADNINHENVDTGFDCVDEKGESLQSEAERDEEAENERLRKEEEERYAQITQLRTEMLECEINLRKKMAEEGCQTQTEEARND